MQSRHPHPCCADAVHDRHADNAVSVADSCFTLPIAARATVTAAVPLHRSHRQRDAGGRSGGGGAERSLGFESEVIAHLSAPCGPPPSAQARSSPASTPTQITACPRRRRIVRLAMAAPAAVKCIAAALTAVAAAAAEAAAASTTASALHDRAAERFWLQWRTKVRPEQYHAVRILPTDRRARTRAMQLRSLASQRSKHRQPTRHRMARAQSVPRRRRCWRRCRHARRSAARSRLAAPRRAGCPARRSRHTGGPVVAPGGRTGDARPKRSAVYSARPTGATRTRAGRSDGRAVTAVTP